MRKRSRRKIERERYGGLFRVRGGSDGFGFFRFKGERVGRRERVVIKVFWM